VDLVREDPAGVAVQVDLAETEVDLVETELVVHKAHPVQASSICNNILKTQSNHQAGVAECFATPVTIGNVS
jgi:hypothetical protein